MSNKYVFSKYFSNFGTIFWSQKASLGRCPSFLGFIRPRYFFFQWLAVFIWK